MAPKSSLRGSLRRSADQYLAECFAQRTPPHVNELARLLGLSSRGFGRAFTGETGFVAGAYFKNARIERAKELLRSTNLSLTAIALGAGFGTRTTMFRAFRRAVGVTPAAYRSQV